MYVYSGAWSLSLCSQFLTTYFTCHPPRPGARVLCHTSNQRGSICTWCWVWECSGSPAHPKQGPPGWCITHFNCPSSCFISQTFILELSSKTTKEQTCRAMRVSVNHERQQHCLMQEATGVGSVQSRECLPFDYRTMSKEWDFEDSYLSLQPFLPFFSPAGCKSYKQQKPELCKISII